TQEPVQVLTGLSREEREELKLAKQILENPGIAAKLTALAGAPIDRGMKMLPSSWQSAVHDATRSALLKALDVAVKSLGRHTATPASNRIHRLAVAASGAAGGAFGLPALTLELPLSTTVMLRSIADIAAAQGEDPRNLETKLACLSVFALGSTRDP